MVSCFSFQSWFDFNAVVEDKDASEKIIAQEKEQHILSMLHQVSTEQIYFTLAAHYTSTGTCHLCMNISMDTNSCHTWYILRVLVHVNGPLVNSNVVSLLYYSSEFQVRCLSNLSVKYYVSSNGSGTFS